MEEDDDVNGCREGQRDKYPEVMKVETEILIS